MHIQSVHIDNFRRFERFDCELDPRLTLLMGVNGAGKSSLLKAISLPIAGFIARVLDTPAQRASLHFEMDDVRQIHLADPAGELWRTPVLPSLVRIGVDAFGASHQFTQEHDPLGAFFSAEFDPHYAHALAGSAEFSGARSWFQPGNASAIPLFARFGAQNVQGSPRANSLQKPFENKQQIWERFSNDEVDIGVLAQWFQYNELRTLQEGKPPLIYAAVKGSVLASMHASDIKYVVRDNQLMVLHDDHGWRPFHQLSDGQKRLAAIYMELAIRAATLNSHLGANCVAETPGIVLIDELDLHLHPQWQRSVIENLLTVFPKLQFIVASHSPFLIQAALERGAVIDMATGQRATTADHSIEDIAENVMGVDQPQRSQRFLEMRRLAQDYLELLETPAATPEAKAALKARLDLALSVFADDPAAAAWLSQRRVVKGL
ncbi:AAA family ATPase [Roseateles amylovorans]|uniref:AAA family ATPase n=1 Tax=Roseateles amylovorans TaxID=2978473 RepID=A0ABY6B221_9BURK|nr:AAA family ATPase [Roseateles amylovorans]UXH78759.1 AAA family ATPase [Roseateles amylovorans]